MTRRVAAIGVFLTCGLVTIVAQDTPVFRAGIDAVTVTVSVKDGNRPVTGLTLADFQLLDNGVKQEVSLTSAEALPIDVILLLDTSGSLDDAALTRMRADLQDITNSLQPNDRVRFVPFSDSANDAFGWLHAKSPLPAGSLRSGGSTAFYDAIAEALMLTPDLERPLAVLALSDALDNSSLLGPRELSALADYSSASLYLGILVTPPKQQGSTGVTFVAGHAISIPERNMAGAFLNQKPLEDAAARTGGSLFVVSKNASSASIFRNVLADLHTSYVLSYRPTGVPRPGWHDIVVTTSRKGATVRARRGYEGR